MFSDSLKGAPLYYTAACLLIDVKSLSIAVSLFGLLRASTLYAYNLCLHKCNLLHQFISHCRERLSKSGGEHTTFAGRRKGQSIVALLAACCNKQLTQCCLISLMVSHTHLLQLTGTRLVSWTDLTPQQAYFKQAQWLAKPNATSAPEHPRLHSRR